MSEDETETPDGSGGAEAGAAKVKQAKSRPAKQAKGKATKSKKGGKADHKKPLGKKAKADAAAVDPSVARHPRAGRFVRRAKGWGGLVGFAVAAYLSAQAGVPTYEVGIRALVAGAAGYLLAWACSVTVWRHLVLAELRLVYEKGQAERAERGADAGAVARRERA